MRSKRLVLASASPRRRELLQRLALDFDVEPADIDETVLGGESAADYVTRLAEEKAAAIARPDTIVIGADTAVVVDGQILGKPADHPDALRMLGLLGDRVHDVITAVAVAVDGERTVSATEVSHVTVEATTDHRRAWYLETGEPFDKAGGYALQGAGGLFADRVNGSVSNVIGLPLPLLDRLCGQLGVDLLTFADPAS